MISTINQAKSLYEMYMAIIKREGQAKADEWADTSLTSGEFIAMSGYKIAQERKQNRNWEICDFVIVMDNPE